MWVCLCNSLRDRDIEAAIDHGAETPAEVFRYHGCTARCGKCVPNIVEKCRVQSNKKAHAHEDVTEPIGIMRAVA